MNDYAAFLDGKRQLGGNHGFDPAWQPDFLYDFQADLTAWAIRKGRAAIFADCGLGKTPMQLVWAENVVRHTGKRVLILTPLAERSFHTSIQISDGSYGIFVSRPGSLTLIILILFFLSVLCASMAVITIYTIVKRSII